MRMFCCGFCHAYLMGVVYNNWFGAHAHKITKIIMHKLRQTSVVREL